MRRLAGPAASEYIAKVIAATSASSTPTVVAPPGASDTSSDSPVSARRVTGSRFTPGAAVPLAGSVQLQEAGERLGELPRRPSGMK